MRHFIKLFAMNVMLLLLVTGCVGIPIASAYTVQYNEISYTYSDLDTLKELIGEQVSNMNAAHQMAEAARQLGYEEDHDVITLAKTEWEEANNLRFEYQTVYDNLMKHWHQKEEEYPVATYIWNYFKELGYNDYVCAGILGNIMTEVGGQTLDVQYSLRGNGYYGMCQWNKVYSEVWGASLEEQCAFLRDTIAYETDTFGYAYKKGFNYNDFLNITDCKQAAKAFAACYERCGRGSYTVRQNNAVVAYNYFIGE